MEVTIKLLENAMTAAMKEKTTGEGWTEGRGRFLIDGFPRKMDQAIKFDETVCLSSMAFFCNCIQYGCRFACHPRSFSFPPQKK